MRQVERSAASVEEALEAALEELGASEQEADVQILQEPRGGFLGLGSQVAVVRVTVRDGEGQLASDGDEQPSEDSQEEDLDEQAELAADFLEGLFELMDLGAEAEPKFVEGTMYVDIWGIDGDEGMGILIGRHGQTLDGLQELVRGAVQSQTGERCRVVVDVEDYRKRRRAQLASRARGVARRVQKTGRPETLEPMTAYERKVVHDAVADLGGLETASEGEEPDRRVVIKRGGGVSRETPGPRVEPR